MKHDWDVKGLEIIPHEKLLMGLRQVSLKNGGFGRLWRVVFKLEGLSCKRETIIGSHILG